MNSITLYTLWFDDDGERVVRLSTNTEAKNWTGLQKFIRLSYLANHMSSPASKDVAQMGLGSLFSSGYRYLGNLWYLLLRVHGVHLARGVLRVHGVHLARGVLRAHGARDVLREHGARGVLHGHEARGVLREHEARGVLREHGARGVLRIHETRQVPRSFAASAVLPMVVGNVGDCCVVVLMVCSPAVGVGSHIVCIGVDSHILGIGVDSHILGIGVGIGIG